MSVDLEKFSISEQSSVGFFAAIVGTLTAWDLLGDAKTGSHFGHLFLEGTILIISFIFVTKTFHALYNKHQKANLELLSTKKESIILRLDNKKYREDASRLLLGVGALIDKQLINWKLSNSEKDVALLLLKGLSLKEIAAIRSTSEKTVRQQAGKVYEKANLEGRAQLSAFFLEDLLLPREN